MGKKKYHKGIESLGQRIEEHRMKREIALASGDEGLAEYHRKELKNLQSMKERRELMVLPRSERIKIKKGGWFNDRNRHALAAMGIRTKRKQKDLKEEY